MLGTILEADYGLVAQAVHDRNIPVIISRLDVHKHSQLTNEFDVTRLPTLMFVRGQSRWKFEGERSWTEVLDFVVRLQHPPILTISNCQLLQQMQLEHETFFVETSKTPSVTFATAAAHYRSFNWFVSLISHCESFRPDSIFVLKRTKSNATSQTIFKTKLSRKSLQKAKNQEKDIIGSANSLESIYDPVDCTQYSDVCDLQQDLFDWILKQRFSIFTEVSEQSIEHLLLGRKWLAIIVLKQQKLLRKFVANNHSEAYEMMGDLASSDLTKPLVDVQFAWIGDPELANRIVMKTLHPLPAFLLLNTRTHQFTLIEDQLPRPDLVLGLLNGLCFDETSFRQNQHLLSGGSNVMHRFQRRIYRVQRALQTMYDGNPTLVLILFALPSLFGLFILYGCCCSSFDPDLLYESKQKGGHPKQE